MQLSCSLLCRIWGKEKELIVPVNLEKAISLHILNRIRKSASSDHVAGSMYTKHFKKMIKQRDYFTKSLTLLRQACCGKT
jgi:hypothetical protein